jgi:hypothetical protein
MFRCVCIGLVCLAASAAMAQQTSQQGDPPSTPPQPVSSDAAKPVVAMEEPQPGDRWIYDVHDEVADTVTNVRTFIVTEVTPKEITVRWTNAGKADQNLVVFDRFWNVISANAWKYSPNDGEGLQAPLAVGKTWSFRLDAVNAGTGNIWKRSGSSKVVGQESLTTKAGTFETFKVETSYTAQDVKDPTRKTESKVLMWYAPAIDHWVKRSFALRANKHLLNNVTLELVEYGRKP